MRFNFSMILLKGDVLCPCLQPPGLREERVTRRKAVNSVIHILFSPEVHIVLMTSSGGCPLVFLEGQYVGWGPAGDDTLRCSARALLLSIKLNQTSLSSVSILLSLADLSKLFPEKLSRL